MNKQEELNTTGNVVSDDINDTSGKKQKKKRRDFSDNLIVLYIEAFCVILAGQIVGEILCIVPASINSDAVYTGTSYFKFIGIWIVALLTIWLSKKNRPIFGALWTKASGNNWKGLVLGFLLGFFLNGLCILVAVINGDISLYFDSFKPISFIIILLCVFVQSSAEELVCRGFLYQRLKKSYKNPWVAIIGNALLFAVLHLFNDGVTVLSVLNIFVVGILFSLMVYYADSLWCAMAVHTAWNFTQNIIFGLPNSGIVMPYSVFKLDASTAKDSFAYNVAFGIEGTILADIVLILACVILCLWGKKKGRSEYQIWE